MNSALLGNLVEIKGGGTPRRDLPEYWGGSIPWATVKDFVTTEIDSTQESVTELGVSKSATNIIPAGNIIVPTRMALGKAAINLVDVAINQDLKALILIDPKSIDRDYLFRFFLSKARYIESRGKGATVKGIRLDVLKELEIPLPPVEEQKHIAAILDKADAIRRKRRQAIQLADEFLRSVFLDMFGDIFHNQKNWRIETVEALCSKIIDCPHSTPKYSSGKTPYPCIRTSDLHNGFLEWSTTKYVDRIEYENRVKRHTPISKDILYSREVERFGMAAMVGGNTTPCLGQRMMLFQANPNKTEPEFLWYLLTTKGIYAQAKRLVGGSTSPHVNVGDIKKFKAFCPPIKLQKKFSKFVIGISRIRQNFQKMENKDSLLFNSLSQHAFNGEL